MEGVDILTDKSSYHHARAEAENFFVTANGSLSPFKKNTWDAYQYGKSGLVHAPTGTGKTYAVWTPTLLEWMSEQKDGKIREA